LVWVMTLQPFSLPFLLGNHFQQVHTSSTRIDTCGAMQFDRLRVPHLPVCWDFNERLWPTKNGHAFVHHGGGAHTQNPPTDSCVVVCAR
jgi:hypothetical protein